MNDQKSISLVFLVLGLIFLFFSPLLARAMTGISRAKGGNLRFVEIVYIIGGLLGIVIGGIGLLRY